MDALRRLAPYGHWLLRIALASVFVYHGWLKIADPGGGAMLGYSSTLWLLVGLLEAGGGLLVVLGGILGGPGDLLTRLGGAMLIVPMVGAITQVHWGRWSFVPTQDYPMGGMEFQTTLLLLALFFVLMGNALQEPSRPGQAPR